MRKYNSSFKTAFLSEAGSRLKNNDYFGFVELDKYACYVIADGITDMRDSQSARAAIEAVVNAFQAAPGISKGKMRSYIRQANRELLNGKSYEKLKASVTVVITDYQKFRYVHLGNTRLCLYRNGKPYIKTTDMSLSQDMVQREQLPEDKLSQHEERNNLYGYLGQPHAQMKLSGKIKLQDGDIITLYTRGIWENVDDGELGDVFAEAGSEPQAECDKVEDLLLSRQPKNLENYTFAGIYVDKVFTDPNRRKKIKKIITISVIAVVVIAVVILLCWLWYRDRKQKREELAQCFERVEAYIEDHNFVRAKEECNDALKLAQKLKDKEQEEHISAYLIALEAINSADDSYEKADYAEAKDAYLIAKARVRYADNAGLDYIEDRLTQISQYEQVFDAITLGDGLLAYDNYELAEEKYLEAKKLSAELYFDSGKTQALAALDKLYEEWSEAKEEQEAAQKEQAAEAVAAADLVVQGDAAFSDGDYDGAMVFYLIALQKYTQLEDTVQISFLNEKIIALNDKQEEVESRVNDAKVMEEQARLYEAEGSYEQAKLQYQYAKEIYEELGKSNMADMIQGKIDILDTKADQRDKVEEEAKAEEEKKAKEAEEEAQKKAEEEKKAEEQKKAEEELKKAEEERNQAEEERQKAEEERRKAEEERKKAEEERKKAEKENSDTVSGNTTNG